MRSGSYNLITILNHILDRFHIVAKALDEVRAAESRKLARDGHQEILKKSLRDLQCDKPGTFSAPQLSATNTAFGQIRSQANNPRKVQLAHDRLGKNLRAVVKPRAGW
jgi:hypothetical protein